MSSAYAQLGALLCGTEVCECFKLSISVSSRRHTLGHTHTLAHTHKHTQGKGSNRLPAGRKDCIATQASACLRFLALVPDFMPELIGVFCLRAYECVCLCASLFVSA